MFNNALPLLGALAGAAAGDPAPRHEPPPDVGFLDAFLSDTLVHLAIFFPFFLIMAMALWRSGVWERRVIREELAGEVGHAVSASEYQEIAGDRVLRTRRVDRMQRRLGGAGERAARARVPQAPCQGRRPGLRARSNRGRMAGGDQALAGSRLI
jgi:hypothetical protein